MQLIAHAQLLSVLEREFGRNLSDAEVDELARRLSRHARAVTYEPGAYVVRAGNPHVEVHFIATGTSEVLVDGRVVNTMIAPCLIGETALQESTTSTGAPDNGTAAAGAPVVASGGRNSVGDSAAAAAAREAELRARLATSAHASSADVRTKTACSSYAVPVDALIRALCADANALAAWRRRAQKAFVSDLFRSICDLSDVSYEREGQPSLPDILWAALRYRSVPPHALLASDRPRPERQSVQQATARARLTAGRAGERAARAAARQARRAAAAEARRAAAAAAAAARSGEDGVEGGGAGAAAAEDEEEVSEASSEEADEVAAASEAEAAAAAEVCAEEGTLHFLARGTAARLPLRRRSASPPARVRFPRTSAVAAAGSDGAPSDGEAEEEEGARVAAEPLLIQAPYLLKERRLLAPADAARLPPTSVVSTSACDIYSLDPADFQTIASQFPEFSHRLRRAAELQNSGGAARGRTARLLARFVPSVVLQRLSRQPPLRSHEVTRFDACVGFVDISGFTRLSMLLREALGQRRGAEALNRIVRAASVFHPSRSCAEAALPRGAGGALRLRPPPGAPPRPPAHPRARRVPHPCLGERLHDAHPRGNPAVGRRHDQVCRRRDPRGVGWQPAEGLGGQHLRAVGPAAAPAKTVGRAALRCGRLLPLARERVQQLRDQRAERAERRRRRWRDGRRRWRGRRRGGR